MQEMLEDVPLSRTVVSGGVKVETGVDKFDIVCQPLSDLWEQQLLKLLKDWIRMRKKHVSKLVD
jgi:hypothetical protein